MKRNVFTESPCDEELYSNEGKKVRSDEEKYRSVTVRAHFHGYNQASIYTEK